MQALKPARALMFLPLLVSAALGQFEPYRLRLGPGNEDLERQIQATPWTRYNTNILMKDVSHVDFSGRDLRLVEINLEGHGLYRANFDDCRLDGSSLIDTWLLKCSFRNASLRFCEIDALSRDPRLLNDFRGADITGSWIHGLSGALLQQTKNFREKRLTSIPLRGDLSGLSFRGFDLYNVSFFFPVEGCDFTEARMQRVVISDRFRKEQLYSTANYKSKDLSTLLFQGFAKPENPRERGNFFAWDFSGCELSYFLNCDLTDASFEDSLFLRTRGLRLEEMSLDEGVPVWLYYRMVKIAEIGFDDCLLSEEQLRQTANWKRRDLRGMHLRNMALDGWDFSGLDMQMVDLGGSSLRGTIFANSDISGIRLVKCRNLTVAQLLQSVTYSSRANIVRTHFDVDFADLTDEEKELQAEVRRRHSKGC